MSRFLSSYVASPSSEASEANEVDLVEMGINQGKSLKNWDENVQPEKTELAVLLDRFIKNGNKFDLTVAIGTCEFKCHFLVLRCYSKFFYDLEKIDSVTLPEEKVTTSAFNFIYDWMLNSKSKVHRECLMEVFVASYFLKIHELIEQCWACMDSLDHFIEDTAFALYLEGRKMNDEVVPDLMMTRISRFFLVLVASKEFVDFEVDEVVTLLSSNSIAVHSETEVLYSAMRWLYYDWDEREKHLMTVISCVRFGLIPPWQLVTLTRTSNSREIQTLMEYTEVYKMVETGLHYVVSKFHYGINDDFLPAAMEKLNLKDPVERMWIDEDLKEEKCVKYWLTNYYTFLEYLEMLKSQGVSYWNRFQYKEKSVEMQPSDPRLNAALKALSETLMKK